MKFRSITILALCLLATVVTASWIHTAENPAAFQAVSETAPGLYWITFTGDTDEDSVFLMQIDSLGAIKIQPKNLIPASSFGGEKGATALGNRTLKLMHLFHWGEDGFLFRAVINKPTVSVTAIKKVAALETEDDDHLQVTQRAAANFLIAEIPAGELKLVPLNKKGLPAGDQVQIAGSAPRENDEASLSADGRMLLTVRQDSNDPTPPKEKLFVVPISADGKSSARGQSIGTFEDIEAADVSNPLPNGTRFVAFIIDDHEDQNGDLEDQVRLQIINAAGKKLGDSILISNVRGRAADDQNVAIDPLGGFVIFTVTGDKFNCEDKDVLVYQRLRTTGRPRGAAKLLAGCGLVAENIVNIDILKD